MSKYLDWVKYTTLLQEAKDYEEGKGPLPNRPAPQHVHDWRFSNTKEGDSPEEFCVSCYADGKWVTKENGVK